MHTKRFLLAILVVLLIITSGYLTKAEEKKYNKNISIVFDDSGSMAFDVRWAHANYALQTLVSVLDDGDILQIHYMNDSKKDIAIEIGKTIATSEVLQLIRDNSVPDLIGDGETPIESISIGLSKFTNSPDSLTKTNTVYDNWLILITDGNEMTDKDGEGYVNYVKDDSFDSGFKWVGVLDRKIAGILSSSSLDFSTVILKIGDTSQDMLLNSAMVGSPLIYKSASVSEEYIEDKQIIENMNEIASLISGRYPINIRGKFGSELTIESEVPFSDFDILLQNSNSQVIEVKDSNGNIIDFKVNDTKLLSPADMQIARRLLESDSDLYGSSMRLTSELEEALPAGEYRVVFDQNIEKAKVTSYCYPFIQFIFNYYVNGLEVEKVFQEDMVTLEFIPVRGGTTIVLQNLPDEINYNLNIKSGDQFLSFEEGSLKTNEFLIRDSVLEGSLIAEIPDIWLWSLYVSESIPVAPEEERPENRVFTLETSAIESSVTYKDIDNASSVYFIPKLNGERLTQDQMNKAELNIVRIYSANGSLTNLDYELIKEGTVFGFRPVYTGFKPAMPSDDYIIEVKFASNEIKDVNEYAFSEIKYSVLDAPFFIRYIYYILIVVALLALGAYLIGIVIKPKLSNKKHHIVKYYYDSILDLDAPVKTEKFKIKINILSRIFIPYVREKGNCTELKIKAGGRAGHIYLLKESQRIGMSIGNFELKADSVAKRNLRLNLNQKLEMIIDGKLVIYRYEEIKL